MLGLAEAEAADIADGTDRAAVILAADGLRAVLNDVEVVLAGNLHDAAHIAYNAVEMHDNDALGALSDLALNVIWVDGGAFVNVTEDRNRARLHNGERRSNERIGGNNHFVARADAQRCDADMQRGSAVRAGNCHFGAAPLCEFFFEFHALMASPVANSAGVKRLGNLCLGLGIKLRPAGEAQLRNAGTIHDNFFFLTHDVNLTFL